MGTLSQHPCYSLCVHFQFFSLSKNYMPCYEKIYFQIATYITTHKNYSILNGLYFYLIQLDNYIDFSHYYKSKILYEDSAVRPNSNPELFRTVFLKYLSEFYCCYIVVVQGKVAETIILMHMTHLAISSFRHYTISKFHHYAISTFQHPTIIPL